MKTLVFDPERSLLFYGLKVHKPPPVKCPEIIYLCSVKEEKGWLPTDNFLVSDLLMRMVCRSAVFKEECCLAILEN